MATPSPTAPPSTPPASVRPLARRLILWFVGVALVPLLATVLLSYWSSRDVVAGLLEENLGKTARLYASEVDDFLAEKTALLTALAGGVEAEDAVLAEVVTRSAMIEELIVLDASGSVVARSDDQASWAVEACRSQGGIARMQHAHHGGHEVVVAVPREGGGSLCGRVSFTLHQDMISERARSTFGGLAYIVDRSGEVVCHAFEEDEPHVHPGQPIQGPAAEHARIGQAWHGVVEVDGRRHFAAYAPAANLPWGVWAEAPVEEAASVLQPMATRALVLGAVLTALLAGVILLLVRRLAAPIEELASASQRIAQGAYGETVPVQRDDEVGLLAREFNAMSTALADAVRTLDAKVAERTAELEAARQFSDTLLDTLDQRILVVGRDRHILKANAAAREAYGPHLVGSGCDTIHETLEGQRCPAEAFFTDGRTETEERVRRNAKGEIEILAVERYPVPGPQGPAALLEIERDVTASKQLQAHLVHQEKMAALGTLAAGLAHEIGNPLASLSSELELLEMDPDSVGDALPVLRDQARRMGVLVRELVDLGRTPTDQRAVFQADELLVDVGRLLRHSAREHGVLLSIEAESLTLCSNRDRLVQVLLNLGLNAVDASPEAATVRIRCRTATGAGAGVVFTVSDEGEGLPDDTSALFEPFFTTKPVGQGTGLGLFVVDRLVTALGGQIRAENADTGGAVFTVTLPDSTESAESAESADPADPSRSGSEG